MKNIFTLLCGLALSYAAISQTSVSNISQSKITKSPVTSASETSTPATESLNLKETEFDFGKIPQGKPVTHVFEFTNTGTIAFALDNVQASCGCTTPVWNKDIIAPGATAKITVGYNAQNEGQFVKPVTITYNGTQTKQITIKGDVWKTPVTSAPENTSVNSLKNEQ